MWLNRGFFSKLILIIMLFMNRSGYPILRLKKKFSDTRAKLEAIMDEDNDDHESGGKAP